MSENKDFDIIMHEITGGLTGDPEKDMEYLQEIGDKYKDHEFGKEISDIILWKKRSFRRLLLLPYEP